MACVALFIFPMRVLHAVLQHFPPAVLVPCYLSTTMPRHGLLAIPVWWLEGPLIRGSRAPYSPLSLNARHIIAWTYHHGSACIRLSTLGNLASSSLSFFCSRCHRSSEKICPPEFHHSRRPIHGHFFDSWRALC
jgi:hypothetical protein